MRQVVHGHKAALAARHASAVYPQIMDGDTAAQLFALLTDTAWACLIQSQADLADPGPGGSGPSLPPLA